MSTVVCKHGLPIGIIIEGSFDYDAHICSARMPICEQCAQEIIWELIEAAAQARKDEK